VRVSEHNFIDIVFVYGIIYLLLSRKDVPGPVCDGVNAVVVLAGVYGGGTFNNAEIFGYYGNLAVYRSRWSGSKQLTYAAGTVRSTMLVNIGHREMYVTNYQGYTKKIIHNGLFYYKITSTKSIYMGLNRVIDNAKGNPYHLRTGRGLCSVCIYYHSSKIY